MSRAPRDSRPDLATTPSSTLAAAAMRSVGSTLRKAPARPPIGLPDVAGAPPARHPTPTSVATFCHRALATRDRDELATLIDAWLTPFGFVGFSFGETRRVNDCFIDEVQLVHWNPETTAGFIDNGLYRHDPVLLQFLTAVETFTWDLSIFDTNNPEHQALKALRQRAGAVEGIVAVACGPFPARFSLFASGRDIERSSRMSDALTIATAVIAAQINRFGHEERPPARRPRLQVGAPLSMREREVIRWAAAGKSSRETATILAISEHTVNEYIASAIHKLNVANRTEAVAHALLTNQVALA